MAGAGIFLSNNETPESSALQMTRFCVDSIRGMKDVNEKLNVNNSKDVNMRVRIGIAFGGPVRGGVMGISKPVFDLWGETVNEAERMEAIGKPMKVHINSELYKVVKKYKEFKFIKEEDGTYTVDVDVK
ncbi:Adenylate and Guanylate cyclase catalytic domain containing protein [Histomonas meleagridis]|uniref:Adenylate and Guanylate cyclase catalytic domain containing protein n=1 Tax=Histomonas meleagridis TaxID=135588 RepID=UPI00355A66AA|nr:Adenylate and Guanylate cyclase catalytic domain containing protein [Histomonas meleagridis]KAH0806727.1 Adenylate and Guanylate cyclase catalytic domain containing protein [Histomonas meleagridis]